MIKRNEKGVGGGNLAPECNELQARMQIVEEIAQGLSDIDAGRTQTTEQVRETLALSRQERSDG